MDGPLDGIRILEVANWLAAPLGVAILADMGADVVKIELPNGDPYRGLALPGIQPGALFAVGNRGKRGMTLNLESAGGQSIVRRLAAQADVVVTNFTPSRAERYSITYAALSADHPRLIFAQLTGYGAEGPERDRLGFDYAAFWARSGMMHQLGEEGRAPPIQRPGMGDQTTALTLVCAVLGALFERERSGRGQELRCSLLHAGMWVLGIDVQAALLTGDPFPRHDRRAPANPIWNTYCCGDGRWLLLVMPQPDPYWPRVCAAIDRPELAGDPRYDSLQKRSERSAELVQLLDVAFGSAPLAEWSRRLDAHGVIWAPAQSVADLTRDPQARANGYVTTIEDPTFGTLETVQAPIHFGRSSVGPRGPAPAVGQHTEQVLLELGCSWDEIGEFRDHGAL